MNISRMSCRLTVGISFVGSLIMNDYDLNVSAWMQWIINGLTRVRMLVIMDNAN